MALAAGVAFPVAVSSLTQPAGSVVTSNVQPMKVALSGSFSTGSLAISHGRSRRVQSAPVRGAVSVKAVAMQDSLTDEDSENNSDMGFGQRELKDYPPGFQRYETMAVLRPDISEEQRLALTQRYEEVQ
jgi:hypothetical protein